MNTIKELIHEMLLPKAYKERRDAWYEAAARAEGEMRNKRLPG
jgi:hypothetical protein